jgi:hypothetical protein
LLNYLNTVETVPFVWLQKCIGDGQKIEIKSVFDFIAQETGGYGGRE